MNAGDNVSIEGQLWNVMAVYRNDDGSETVALHRRGETAVCDAKRLSVRRDGSNNTNHIKVQK